MENQTIDLRVLIREKYSILVLIIFLILKLKMKCFLWNYEYEKSPKHMKPYICMYVMFIYSKNEIS